MAHKASPEATQTPAYTPELLVEKAVKQNTGRLLGKFSAAIATGTGSEFLALRLASVDENSGLGTGLRVITDRVHWPNGGSAFEQQDGRLDIGYCSRFLSCLMVRELSEGNLNVQDLDWDTRGRRHSLAYYQEYGLANLDVEEVVRNHSHGGMIERMALARSFGVGTRDFALTPSGYGDMAEADAVNRFFDGVFATDLDNMHVVDPFK